MGIAIAVKVALPYKKAAYLFPIRRKASIFALKETV
jgi:hypothetical protein